MTKKPNGRPPTGRLGRTVSVYLDTATEDLAREIGQGNVSVGLRAIRVMYQKAQDADIHRRRIALGLPEISMEEMREAFGY